jgi:hypothetical protein
MEVTPVQEIRLNRARDGRREIRAVLLEHAHSGRGKGSGRPGFAPDPAGGKKKKKKK